MPLFELADDELIPFRRETAGPDLYEMEIRPPVVSTCGRGSPPAATKRRTRLS